MSTLPLILVASWLAGVAAFAGGLAAKAIGPVRTKTARALVHGVVAFGGGILMSAVALALVPHAMDVLPVLPLVVTFCTGGTVFAFVDHRLAQGRGRHSQMLAMLLDFVPEAISMGAVFVADRKLGLLLAAFIGAQNLPEGFNSFREATESGEPARRTLITLLCVSLLGPLAALAGHLFLRDVEAITGGIMSFAAGGILYLVFQDLAPQSAMRTRWMPTLGAVLGFAVGMAGTQLLH